MASDENTIEGNYKTPPYNFSWIIKGELCACAWPQTKANVEYLK